ncbi:MAG: hypothetical protein WCF12_03235 [Propionicimonas sp.]
MKRLLLILLPVFLLFAGCAQLMGTSDWDTIQVTYSGSAVAEPKGNYTFTITPTEATYTIDGKSQSVELPKGAWDALGAGVRGLGERTSQPCPGSQTIGIIAKSAGVVSQSFEASSCDAGGVFDQAQQLVNMLLQLVR